jgi:hypothetical protein
MKAGDVKRISGLLSVALERNACNLTVDGRKVFPCQLKLQRAAERQRGG